MAMGPSKDMLRDSGFKKGLILADGDLLRVAHGRWRAVETPDQSYTFVHQAKMVALATY